MKKLSLLCALSSLLLIACGDSSGESKSTAPENGEVVDPVAETYATEDDLPGCIEKFKGDVALVEKDSVAFKCEDGRWVNKGKYIATEENIKNCTEKREGEIAYIVDEDKSLVCEDGKWVKASAKVPDKVGEPAEPAEGSSTSKVSSSSSWNEVTGSSSSSSRKDEQNESSSESKVPEPAEGSSSSNEKITSNSSSSRNDAQGESSSSSVSSSSFVGCKTAEADNCEYGELVDDRDGQKYKTVKIGDQWWMAENLNYADSAKTPTLTGNSWCYNNELDSCAKYGRLYSWVAAVDKSEEECGNGKTCGLSDNVQGVCPIGWHLPSGNEWNTLYSAMGSSPYAMQAKDFAKWNKATDAYGFSVLPAGGRYPGSDHIGAYANFWSSSEKGDYSNRWLLGADGASLGYDSRSRGFSVRCVKD
jgi:uncharacterized protein (TIGR02145 family)